MDINTIVDQQYLASARILGGMLETVLDHTPVPVAVSRLKDNQLLYVNKECREMFLNGALDRGTGESALNFWCSSDVDDFGTGYSSLYYLKNLPLKVLKVDQSFIRDLPSDPNDAIITSTIITLGKQFGLTIVAEGVENEEQLAFLKEKQCDQIPRVSVRKTDGWRGVCRFSPYLIKQRLMNRYSVNVRLLPIFMRSGWCA